MGDAESKSNISRLSGPTWLPFYTVGGLIAIIDI